MKAGSMSLLPGTSVVSQGDSPFDSRDLFNAWHQRHFGCMPSYEVYNLGTKGFGCAIRFYVPENDKGIQTSQRIDVNEHTRSEAREEAAFLAYAFVDEV